MSDLLVLSGVSDWDDGDSPTEYKLGLYNWGDTMGADVFFLIYSDIGNHGAASLFKLVGFTRYELAELEAGETLKVYTCMETGTTCYLDKEEFLHSFGEDVMETISLTASFVPDYKAIEEARIAAIPTDEDLAALMGTKEEVEGDWSDTVQSC